MIANTAFLAAITTFLLASWLAGELSYLAAYKTALFRTHGLSLGIGTILVFLNLCGLYYWVARALFLRDTRKLRHLDRQLGTADGVIDELRDQLGREESRTLCGATTIRDHWTETDRVTMTSSGWIRAGEVGAARTLVRRCSATLEHGRAADASDIAWGLMFFWFIRGHAAEGLRWYEQILNLPSLPPAVESRAVLGAAVMQYTQGEHASSRIGAIRALALATGVGDIDMAAQAEHLFGYVEYALGDMNAARSRFARSVQGFRTQANPWGAGHALTGLAAVALVTGDAAEGERLLDEATAALRHAGPWFLSLGLYLRATLAVRRGSPDQAIVLARGSLTSIRELHDKFAFIYTLVPLAAAAALKADDAWTARILGMRDALIERTGVAIVDRPVHDLHEQAEREARARLGSDRWAAAHAAGRRSSIDALLQDIDAVLAGGRAADAPLARNLPRATRFGLRAK